MEHRILGAWAPIALAAFAWGCGTNEARPMDGGVVDASLDGGDGGEPRDVGAMDVGLGDAGDTGDTGDVGPRWRGATIGGAGDDEVMDLLVDEDQVLVGGYRDGVLGVENIEPAGDAAGFVRAYSFDGVQTWERLFDTDGTDTVEALLQEESRVWVVGRTTAAFAGFTHAGSDDLFLAEIPAGGASAEVRLQIGDERPQHPLRLVRGSDGALYAGGLNETYVLGSAVEAWEDPLLVKISMTPAPELAWMRRDDTAEQDYAFALFASDDREGALIGGALLEGVGRGAFVRSVDASGGERWRTRIGRTGLDNVAALLEAPEGKVYVVGTTGEVLGARGYGAQDVFVAVLDPSDGAISRFVQAGSEESEWVRDAAVAGDGRWYIGGSTYGGVGPEPNRGDGDAFVLAFDASGAWVGAWQRGSPGLDEVVTMAVAPDGSLWIGGYAQGGLEGEGFGRRDGFVLRLTDADFVAAPTP